VITISIDEPQTLPLKEVNPPADAAIEIQFPTTADPTAISLPKAEIHPR
jgi:hypothetical protein